MTRRHELSWKLKHNLSCKGAYVLVLTQPDSENLMEIYPYELSRCREEFKKKTVIGIALGKDEALGLARNIIEDVHTQTGSFDIKGYFSKL